MSESSLRFRQIHLDFHTSEAIGGVGAAFDAEEFASVLAEARVNSVTAFARCHHGWIYYATQAHPERIHPHLVKKDLLAEQIEACHRRDIRVPIYTTVQWDHYSADMHRDWLCVDEKSVEFSTPPLEAGFYRFMDVFHPGYRAFLKEHVREILTTLPTDGLFFDIVQARPSLAKHWMDAMKAAGVDAEHEGERQRFATRIINEWKLEMTAFIRQYNKDCTIFYNSGHVGPRHRDTTAAYTHYELESLPSGGWGYTHFPQTMRYARGMGKDCMGMTGKFHTSWGDFSSFKNEAALQFECFQMLALGAKCSIGDQLHPSGRIDRHTYDLIGGIYREVEKKEPWCEDVSAVAEIAILTPEEFVQQRPAFHAKSERDQAATIGALRMLQEMHREFDIIDAVRDLSPYKLVILPDEVPVAEMLARRIEAYLAGGGAIIASHKSGLALGGSQFASDAFGIRLKGDAPFSPDFIVPRGEMGRGLRSTAHVMYLQGMEVGPLADAEVLASVETPYFNRTWQHFCSHRHTPSSGQPGYPAIIRAGRCIYFIHPIFTQYQQTAPRWCRQLVENAIDLLVPQKLIETDGPSTLLVSLNRQEKRGRHVLHLLHYIPERRGQAFDTIEDIIPLHEVKVSVAIPAPVKGVRIVPEGAAIPFAQTGGRVSFIVPKVEGHCMIEIA